MNETMIQKLNIEKFRGLNSLHIGDLSQINVFVGANNSGKTSILEAIKILSAPKDIGQLVAVALRRCGADSERKKRNLVNYVLNVFQQEHDKDENKERIYSIQMDMEVSNHLFTYEADGTVGAITNTSGEQTQTLDIAIGTSEDNKKTVYTTDRIVNGREYFFEAEERPIISTILVASSINYYQSCVWFLSTFILREGKSDIIKILQSFDNDIEDINIVGEDIYLYNSRSGSLPLFAYGLGLQKAVFLTSLIALFRDGIVMIDEIDNAIHVSAFERVFTWFIEACLEYNVQAFFTTHSAEAIDAIIRTVENSEAKKDLLRIITLRKDTTNNITRYKMRSGQEALDAREQFGMELRI